MEHFFCGTARRCITPPPALLPDLRGLKQHRFAGVLDDLYVRVVVLDCGAQRAVLIGFDMTTAPCSAAFLQETAKAAGAPVENILFFSTHTHAVPFNGLDLEERERQTEETIRASEAYTRFLHAKTLEAVQSALSRLLPARMGYVWGKSAVNVVRLQDYHYRDAEGKPFTVCNLGADPDRAADRSLFALRVEDASGRALAFLVNYAMHNVTTIWNDFDGHGAMGVSGDVGGEISRMLEKQYPGSVALWSSGAAGDLNPLMLNETILPDPLTGRTCEVETHSLDYALLCKKIMAARHGQDVQYALSGVRCSEAPQEIAGTVEWSVTPGCSCVRRPGRKPEFFTGPDVPAHTVRLQMLRIGSLTLCGVGAELYSSLGMAMRNSTPDGMVLITHNASLLSHAHYILDDETLARCDASQGFSRVPGYDEYRCQAGVMRQDLCAHAIRMAKELEGKAR